MVSIIIPIYKVEKYIKRCIESILSQTYSDLEIILVDDGSPDSSGMIAEDFAAKDNRVVVIHQKNQGVSGARNTGLDAAKGKYVVFVDADDYIEKNYIEILVKGFRDNTQLSIINYAVNGKAAINEKSGVYDKEHTAIRLFTRQSFMGYLFNKMFLRSIIKDNNIRFSVESHWCEDALFCSEYVLRINNSVYCDSVGYNYIVRSDSATNMKYNEKHFSVLDTYNKIMDTMETLESTEVNEILEVNYLIHCVNIKRMLLKSNHDNKKISEYVDPILRSKRRLIFGNRMGIRDKIKYIACLLGARI